MNLHQITPHKTPYHPTFWLQMQEHKKYSEIFDEFILLSLGGTVQPPWIKELYNRLARKAFQKLGYRFLFEAHDKKKFLSERKLI